MNNPTSGTELPLCDQEIFEKGVSVGLFDIPKGTAEAICKAMSAVTGHRIDWHYIGGRVHIKALAHPAAQAVDEEAEWLRFEAWFKDEGFYKFKDSMWAAWLARAALAAPVQSEQEPIHQVMYMGAGGGGWTDIDDPKAPEYQNKFYQVRTVYAAPVRAVRMPDPLAAFAIEIINGSYEGGGLDACNIQDMAVRHGLLRIEERDEPCNPEGCACAEYGFPSECYRHTEIMSEAVTRLNGEQP